MSNLYKRILLKLTGELFGTEEKRGLNFDSILKLAESIKNIRHKTNIQIAIVIGGGNLFRGREGTSIDIERATADYIGMLGTVMNGLALQTVLEKLGVETRVMSSLPIQSVCEPFIRRRAIRHLEKGRVIILAGGTGSPFFTTDSAAALKACELDCDVLLKGSNVDGVFDSDPKKNSDAKMYKTLTYQEALEKGLMVMDNTAFALCQREKVPIIVFNAGDLSNIEKIINGEETGTLVK